MSNRSMAMSGVRMVATDLDGTVIPHGQVISPRTRAALHACTEAGLRVVYVTGRPPRWLTPVVQATGHTGFAICANGSVTLDLGSDSVVALHPIPNDVAAQVAARLRAAVPDVVLGIETTSGLGVEDGYQTVRGAGRSEGLVPTPTQAGGSRAAPSLEDLLGDEPVIKLLAASPGSTPDGLLGAARRVLADLVTSTHSSPGIALLEMGPRGVTKGSALADLAHRWGIAPEEVITFGDMPNDIEMLRWSGTSYAMTGGHPDAIRAADQLAPPANQDGVAQILEILLHSA